MKQLFVLRDLESIIVVSRGKIMFRYGTCDDCMQCVCLKFADIVQMKRIN